jgi:protein-L-isoaspartate(D-aspartate) O-methyltransferase
MLSASEDPLLTVRRGDMVVEQIQRRGVRNPRVLAAMATVPRHAFVDESWVEFAYDDGPLPIGAGQTISQPYMVARATELADPQPGERSLEIGSGCGYQLAVLSQLCARVYGVECLPDLALRAAQNLVRLGIRNAEIQSFDGSGGWLDHAPFDVIVVSAGAPRIPPMLIDQLTDGGRLVIPVGPRDAQQLVRVQRRGDSYVTVNDTPCRYVDLVGRYGFGRTPPMA